jgi:glyoxylase-like metal-dependent hydrolase (beta-lactamase superfamily II)
MIPFVRQNIVQYGMRETLAPLIQRVIANNPGPFTYTGTGTFIVGHDRPGAGVAVIDPGPADEAHLAALLGAVAGRTVSHVLVTHTHRDHAPLARPFAQATGAQIWAAAPPAAEIHVSGSLDEADDVAFAPDHVVTGGERLSGDGWTLEVVATPGHASNHLAFALLEENALFCGDHLMGWSTTVVAPPDGDMAGYMRSLDTVIARRFDTLWPTHGPPITEVAPFLTAYREHRLERERGVLQRLGAGDRTIPAIVEALYAQVDPRLWPPAGLSVQAHLIKLVAEGRAVADPAPTIDARYAPA